MSGTLKTSVCKELALLLEKRAIDTDELIQYELSISIKELFEKMGEEYFRKTEEKTVCSVADFFNVVISTGGGTILSEQSMNILKETCIIVCLTAKADTIYERLKEDDSRPLLNPVTKGTVLKYCISRMGKYERWADFVVATDGKTAQQVALEIKNLLI